MSGSARHFNFYVSHDVDVKVQAHIGCLSGSLGPSGPLGPDRPAAVYVVARLCEDGEVIGLEERTRYGEMVGGLCDWNESLTFVHKFRDLTENAQLAFAVYQWREGEAKALVGGTTLRLFSKKGRLKTGPQRLRLWMGQEADGKLNSGTPGKISAKERGEAGRLEQCLKRCLQGEMLQVDWLDRLTFEKLRSLQPQQAALQQQQEAILGVPPATHLFIQLPTFPHAVLYQAPGPSQAVQPVSLATAAHQEEGSLNSLHDPEVDRVNPAESKARRMRRMLTRAVKDESLMPDTDQRARLDEILRLPPGRDLDEEQQELVWLFRYHLANTSGAALVKFLKSVNWTDSREVTIAAELMGRWADITVVDALQLLSPDFEAGRQGSHQMVRAHAVGVLGLASDEELMRYLLQLVQALRFEATDHSPLAVSLVKRAEHNDRLAIMLHWYLYVEFNDQDGDFGRRAAVVHTLLMEAIKDRAREPGSVFDTISRQDALRAQLNCLAGKLTGRGASARTATLRSELEGELSELCHVTLPSPTDPNVILAGLLPKECQVFNSAMAPLMLVWKTIPRDAYLKASGQRQASQAAAVCDRPAESSGAAASSMAASGTGSPPPHPERKHSGVLGKIQSAAHSAATSIAAGASLYGDHEPRLCKMIYKRGDDLRQDQFVLQMFALMGSIIKAENLELHLTSYTVLPTTAGDGLLQFVEGAKGINDIISEGKAAGGRADPIRAYLRKHNPDDLSQTGMRPEVMKRFVRSCALFSVMTYLLGIGDRHLDNIMLKPDGTMFHIDFGYILGEGPRQYQITPIRVPSEVVGCMGGLDSPHFQEFKKLAGEAYNIIRKNANLILSLFHLMAGSSIRSISADPGAALLKVQDRLRLDLSDQDARQYLQVLIKESASAMMPQVTEAMHRVANRLRG